MAAAKELHYVQDDLRELISPITGETIDSLSKYKRHIKEHGYEITGGEHFTGKGLGDFKAKDLINEAEMQEVSRVELNKSRWGMMPSTEREKELWKEESKMERGESNNVRYLQMQGLEDRSRKMRIPMSDLMSKMKMSY
jgi:hypothetical protein